jgi:hypothetical protein
MIEQADASAEQHRHQLDLYLAEQSGPKALLCDNASKPPTTAIRPAAMTEATNIELVSIARAAPLQTKRAQTPPAHMRRSTARTESWRIRSPPSGADSGDYRRRSGTRARSPARTSFE